jgi:hypothetical protein
MKRGEKRTCNGETSVDSTNKGNCRCGKATKDLEAHVEVKAFEKVGRGYSGSENSQIYISKQFTLR